jgi:hypothetical protein
LDARKLASEHVSQGADEEGFGDSRNALDEDVLAGGDGDQRLFDDGVLANDDLADLLTRSRHHVLKLG